MSNAKATLGEFLRARRESVAPAQVGLPPGLRRRAKGLRREELAILAGISPTWLTWIEQGRAPTVSAAVLDRLAQALRLTRAERHHLFDLAALRDPQDAAALATAASDEGLLDVVQAIRTPAYVLDDAWDATAWNAPAAKLFIGWLDRKSTERNLLRYMFLVPQARDLVVDWPERAARLVAEFRAERGAALDLPALRRAVQALRTESPEFEGLWRRQGVREREGGQRVFEHPTLGRQVWRQCTFRPATAPRSTLVMLV